MSVNESRSLGIYVHVPFCLRKCPYCNFYSVASLELIPEYVLSVCRQIAFQSQVYDLSGFEVDSIYFGGGTPSLLSSSQFGKILDVIGRTFKVARYPEISLECNPCSSSLKLFKGLRRLGFNRLSIGVQSASNEELKLLGRAHFFEQACSVFNWAVDAGFKNLSADFMIGLPGQNLKDLRYSFEAFNNLPLNHISIYMLKIESGTPFKLRFPKEALPDDDKLAEFYESAVLFFTEHGFAHYEISNFAMPGFECCHNLKYWTLQPYFGFGPSAHSYFASRRWFAVPNLKSYLLNPCQVQFDPDIVPKKTEWLMLRSRLSLPITFSELEINGFNPASLKIKLKQLASSGLVHLTDLDFALTLKGFLVQNAIVLYLTTS